MKHQGSIAIGVMMSLMCGCGVVFTTGKPGAAKDKGYVPSKVYADDELTALTYYLPKDVLEVTAQIDEQMSRSIVYQTTKDANGKEVPDKTKPPVLKPPADEPPVTGRKLANLDLSIVTVADRSRPFLIDANSPGFYKNDSTFNVSEAGLLESVNTKTAGAGGQVVQNVLKLAGTVLPFISGVPAIAATPSFDVQAHTPQEAVNTIRGAMIARDQGPRPAAPTPRDSCDAAHIGLGTPDDQAAKEFSEQYFGDRAELRFALPQLSDHRRLKRDFCETFNKLTARRGQLERATNDLAGENHADRIKPSTLKVQAMRSEVDRAADAHKVARDAINTAVAELLADMGVGTVKKTETRKFLLDLKDVPATADVANLAANPVSSAELEKLVEGKERAKELLAKTLTVISLSPVQPLSKPDGTIEGTPYGWAARQQVACKKGLTRPEACVHYREPILYSLKVWTGKKPAPDKLQLQPPEERLLLLVGADSPIRALDLPVNAWTKRDTAITFNARGRVVTLQRNSESSAADATAALQQGLRSGVTEYETSLTSIKTIGETKNAIALQPLQQQIAVAQKQLDLIKAQASLGAASSSTQALLDTELATIEKNLVTAQQQLVAAQNQLLKDTATGENFDETNAMAEANAALAAQIQQLKNEIDLIKLKKELAELQAGGGSTP